MNFLVQWGRNPWGEDILTHAQWNLVYAALLFGVCFMIAHTLYVAFWPKPKGPDTAPVNAAAAARVPERVKRHSLAARMFHWIMAASMLTLLVTSFGPILGMEVRLGADPLDRGPRAHDVDHLSHHPRQLLARLLVDLAEQGRCDRGDRAVQAGIGRSAPAPRKAAKYPWDNKMYHTAIVLARWPSSPRVCS